MEKEADTLTGRFLIAMPGMADPRFAKTVVYLCAHGPDGAMGLVVNKTLPAMSFPDLLEQLDIASSDRTRQIRVHFGGPVEAERGFVLHSADHLHDSSLVIDDKVALTATTDILQDLARGEGPRQCLLALGYAGWGPGQLDQEILDNGWLHADADEALLFDADLESKWDRALGKLGITASMLSGEAGHA